MKNLFISCVIATVALFNFSSCESSIEIPNNEAQRGVSAAEIALPEVQKTDITINGMHFQSTGEEVIYGGDIILADEQIEILSQPQTRGCINANIVKRWPNGIVYYNIAADFISPERVKSAIAHWEANTNIRFVQRAKEANYVEFVNSTGNSSYIGMIGGRQQITASKAANAGTMIHEIGHAVGLYHEHCRSDRDQHVIIKVENLDAAKLYNFNSYLEDKVKGQDVGTFDFGSVMIYDSWAFSTTGYPTMVKKDGSTFYAQRTGLSAGDIAAVKTIYALTDGSTIATPGTTTTTPKNTTAKTKNGNKK